MRSRLSILCGALLLAGCSSQPAREKPAEVSKPKGPGRAPDKFLVRFDTSKGPFTVEVVRDWAPRGADRFHELVEQKFFDEARFFRVVKNFVVQFGIHRDPETQRLWRELKLVDDPVKQSNKRGYIA